MIQSKLSLIFRFQELLNNKPLCVDGSKIESTGFRYEQPVLTKQLLCEVNNA